MVLGPCRTGLAGHLCGVVAVRLRLRDDGGNGRHHQFADVLAHVCTSEWNVAVLPCRPKLFFIHQHLKRTAESLTGLIGFDDIVKVAKGSGLVRVGKGFLEVLRQSLSFLFWVSSVGDASPMDDLNRTVSTHHRQFSRRPGDVVVASNVLARHDVVSTAVGLAQDDRQFGNGGFGKGVEEFRTVADDATPFLVRSGKETGNVLKGQNRDVERVAKSDEASGFVAGIDVKAASEDLGLVRNHTDGVATEVAEPTTMF